MESEIRGVKVFAPDGMEEAEAAAYVDRGLEKYGRTLRSVWVELADDDEVSLKYVTNALPFERIRRITGYLVGSMDKWNNAKRAEERDRVKHGTGDDEERDVRWA